MATGMMAKVYYFKKGGVRVTSLDQVRDLLDEIGISDDGSNTRLYFAITGKKGVISDKERSLQIANFPVTGICLACVGGLGCTCWLSKVDLINFEYF